MEEAFRLNVKWSLQELSRAINGDGKSGPNPLFKVKVVLEGDKVWNIFQIKSHSICRNGNSWLNIFCVHESGVSIASVLGVDMQHCSCKITGKTSRNYFCH